MQAGEHLPEDLQLLNHFWRRTFNERLFLTVHLFIVEAFYILFLFLFYCINEIYKTAFFFSYSFYWFLRPLCLFPSSALSIFGALTPCCLYPLPRLTLPSTQMCLSSVTSWTYTGVQGTNININKFMLLEIVYYIHSAKQWRTRRTWLSKGWSHRQQVTSASPWLLLLLYTSNYADVPVPGWRKSSELEEGTTRTDWD